MKKQLTALVLASISLSSLNGCITQPMDKKFYDWAYLPQPAIDQKDEHEDYVGINKEKEQVTYLKR
ncbi:hypothetical protein J4466_04685 [Candidatus Pacearchaeota archaeon]|nr:hypothetical protein [Candidatus Pacearchaeota archaeon]